MAPECAVRVSWAVGAAAAFNQSVIFGRFRQTLPPRNRVAQIRNALNIWHSEESPGAISGVYQQLYINSSHV